MDKILSLLVVFVCVCFCLASIEEVVFPPPIASEFPGEFPGHLKPFGHQRAPESEVKVYDKPLTAPEFYEKHVKDCVPLIYRNAISKSPAIETWTDDYLREKYGTLDVLVELKRENRTSSSGRMQLQEFLKRYKEENLYVVSMLPSEMMVDVQAVPSVMCGTFKNYTHESNFWMSDGGTRSVIHYDADHNLHCLLAGRKDFMMIENKHQPLLYMATKPKDVGSGYSSLDPDMIDMQKHANIMRVPWTYGSLRPGDCIYIPKVYIHQVRSYGRTVAVTTLFTEDVRGNFEGQECDKVDMEKFHSMAELDFQWTYHRGDKYIDMGYMNVEVARRNFLRTMKEMKVKRVDVDGFLELLRNIMPHALFRKESVQRDVFNNVLGGNKKGYLTRKDIRKLTRHQLKELVRIGEHPHGIVTNGTEAVYVPPLVPGTEDKRVKPVDEGEELQEVVDQLMESRGMDDDDDDDENDERNEEREQQMEMEREKSFPDNADSRDDKDFPGQENAKEAEQRVEL